MRSARGLAKPTLLITVASLVAQVIQWGFFTVVAATFSQADREIYFYAARVPIEIIQATLQSTLNIVFVPLLIRYLRHHDPQVGAAQARAFAGAFLRALGLGLLVMVVIGEIWSMVLAKALTAGNQELPPSALGEIAWLIRVFFPCAAITSLGTILASVHFAHNRFGAPALALIMTTAAQLVTLWLLLQVCGVRAAGWAHLAGATAYLATTSVFAASRRHFQWRWSVRHAGVRAAWRKLGPLFGGTFLFRGPRFIEVQVASSLPKGTVSNLGYAYKLTGALAQLLQRGPVLSLLPHSARDAAHEDRVSGRHAFVVTTSMVLFALLPIVVALIVLRVPIYRCLLERGDFKLQDSVMAANATAWYAGALAALTLNGIAAYSLYARQEVNFMVWAGLIGTVMSAVGAPLLGRLGGYAGLAGAFSLAMIAANGYTYYSLHQHWGGIQWRLLLDSLWRLGLAAALMGVVVWCGRSLCESVPAYALGPPTDIRTVHETLQLALTLVVFGVFGGAVYLGTAALLGSREVASLWALVRDKWRSMRP